MAKQPALLTYTQVADKIAAALGTRPSISTLRTAHSGRGGIVDGLPAPIHPRHGNRSPLFSEDDIDTWLANHPRRARERQIQHLSKQPPEARFDAVAHARAAGLSWADVAQAISRADERPMTRQAVQQRYG